MNNNNIFFHFTYEISEQGSEREQKIIDKAS